MTPETQRLMNVCRHAWAYSPVELAMVIFTRDIGHHTSGWWKNPDYERCWHLSLSYQAMGATIDHDRRRSQLIAEAFFGADVALCWIEGPYSPEGKAKQVWHYRVFADENWEAFRPRGEVYNTEWTPADWKSFSEIHAWSPKQEQAPFLLEAP